MGVHIEAPKFLAADLLDPWELAWAPYDQQTYDFVLALIQPNDIVLDIGAGDLRLALKMARKAKVVYACEIQERLVQSGIRGAGNSFPNNLKVVVGDARYSQFPEDLTLAVLLMRHCKHFSFYAQKLIQAGCPRLVTNARWRMNIEVVHLAAPRVVYKELVCGWYACICGATGFKIGQAENFQIEMSDHVHEVKDCPDCDKYLM